MAISAGQMGYLLEGIDWRRKEIFAFLQKLAPTVIAIEACGASHRCARLLQSFGHSVKLIAPQLVKPYIKRGKNDAAGLPVPGA